MIAEDTEMQQAQIQAAKALLANASFGSRMAQVLRHAWVIWDRQRQRRALLDLDDHQLRDIGKSRQAALMEARKPFWK
jgi:uncharacterized protein YjiS (DUF1127 family)